LTVIFKLNFQFKKCGKDINLSRKGFKILSLWLLIYFKSKDKSLKQSMMTTINKIDAVRIKHWLKDPRTVILLILKITTKTICSRMSYHLITNLKWSSWFKSLSLLAMPSPSLKWSITLRKLWLRRYYNKSMKKHLKHLLTLKVKRKCFAMLN